MKMMAWCAKHLNEGIKRL